MVGGEPYPAGGGSAHEVAEVHGRADRTDSWRGCGHGGRIREVCRRHGVSETSSTGGGVYEGTT
jgi:hypothetical protein